MHQKSNTYDRYDTEDKYAQNEDKYSKTEERYAPTTDR